MKARKLRPDSVATRILLALESYPCATRGGLIKVTSADPDNVSQSLCNLDRDGLIVVIGSYERARAAGVDILTGENFKTTPSTTNVYALAGTPALPLIGGTARRQAPRSRPHGSGVIAGPRTIPQYRWFLS